MITAADYRWLDDQPIDDKFTVEGTFLCGWECPDCGVVCETYWIAPPDCHTTEHSACGWPV